FRGARASSVAVADGRFPRSARSTRPPTVAAWVPSGPAEAGVCLQPADGGEGSDLGGGDRTRRGAWGRFRARQFPETEQRRIYEPSTRRRTEHEGLFGFDVRVPRKLSTGP